MEMSGGEQVVDARYKSCPGPLVSLLRVVRKSKPGARIKLLATDPKAPDDVKEWASRTGHRFLGFRKVEDYFEILIEV